MNPLKNNSDLPLNREAKYQFKSNLFHHKNIDIRKITINTNNFLKYIQKYLRG